MQRRQRAVAAKGISQRRGHSSLPGCLATREVYPQRRKGLSYLLIIHASTDTCAAPDVPGDLDTRNLL